MTFSTKNEGTETLVRMKNAFCPSYVEINSSLSLELNRRGYLKGLVQNSSVPQNDLSIIWRMADFVPEVKKNCILFGIGAFRPRHFYGIWHISSKTNNFWPFLSFFFLMAHLGHHRGHIFSPSSTWWYRKRFPCSVMEILWKGWQIMRRGEGEIWKNCWQVLREGGGGETTPVAAPCPPPPVLIGSVN